VGVTLTVDFEDAAGEETRQRIERPGEPARDGYLALLAATETGYANLMKIVSAAHLGVAESEPPHVKFSALSALGEGLIVLTGGPDGPIDVSLTRDRQALAEERLVKLKAVFGDRLY